MGLATHLKLDVLRCSWEIISINFDSLQRPQSPNLQESGVSLLPRIRSLGALLAPIQVDQMLLEIWIIPTETSSEGFLNVAVRQSDLEPKQD